MREARWFRILTGGATWAAVYNVAWGVAWFAFMSREWLEATTASGRPMPWTPEFWVVWVPLTLPFGMAFAAYLTDGSRQLAMPRALVGSLAIWVPLTLGMSVWAWQEELSARLIILDAAVNLLTVLVASFVVRWSLAARLRAASLVG